MSCLQPHVRRRARRHSAARRLRPAATKTHCGAHSRTYRHSYSFPYGRPNSCPNSSPHGCAHGCSYPPAASCNSQADCGTDNRAHPPAVSCNSQADCGTDNRAHPPAASGNGQADSHPHGRAHPPSAARDSWPHESTDEGANDGRAHPPPAAEAADAGADKGADKGTHKDPDKGADGGGRQVLPCRPMDQQGRQLVRQMRHQGVAIPHDARRLCVLPAYDTIPRLERLQ